MVFRSHHRFSFPMGKSRMPLGAWVFAPTRWPAVLFVTLLQPSTHDTNFFLAGVLYGGTRCCGEHDPQAEPSQASESRAMWERDGPITPAAHKTCMICAARAGNDVLVRAVVGCRPPRTGQNFPILIMTSVHSPPHQNPPVVVFRLCVLFKFRLLLRGQR